MEKKYFILLSFALISFSRAQATQYFPLKFEESVLTRINQNFLTNRSVSQLHEMHKEIQKIKLPDLRLLRKKTDPCICPTINTAHEMLLQRMKFPCIIPLFQTFCQQEKNYLAIYRPSDMSIILNKEFMQCPPSQQLHTMLHELRHAYQHLSGINMATKSKTLSKKIEKDADRFATHALRCFICLLINAHSSPIEKDPLGYFCTSDYDPYLQRALKNNNLCKAHQNISLSNLNSKSLETNKEFMNPNLIDIIPEKIKPLAFSRAPKV